MALIGWWDLQPRGRRPVLDWAESVPVEQRLAEVEAPRGPLEVNPNSARLARLAAGYRGGNRVSQPPLRAGRVEALVMQSDSVAQGLKAQLFRRLWVGEGLAL